MNFRRLMSRRASWAVPYVIFMLLFVVLPLLLVVYYAFLDEAGNLTLNNFQKFVQQPESMRTFLFSIGVALVTTLFCILLGYPAAYFMARAEFSTPKLMAVLFILPMWVNILLRTMSTVALFDFIHVPLGEGALVFGMVYDFLPFMIYPIYNTIQKMDQSYVEAAHDLGATRWQVFWKVTVPISLPGVYSGIVMVFMPTISTFAISELLTNNKVRLFGSIIQEHVQIGGAQLNYGAALSLIMLIIIGLTSFIGSDEGELSKEGGLI